MANRMAHRMAKPMRSRCPDTPYPVPRTQAIAIRAPAGQNHPFPKARRVRTLTSQERAEEACATSVWPQRESHVARRFRRGHPELPAARVPKRDDQPTVRNTERGLEYLCPGELENAAHPRHWTTAQHRYLRRVKPVIDGLGTLAFSSDPTQMWWLCVGVREGDVVIGAVGEPPVPTGDPIEATEERQPAAIDGPTAEEIARVAARLK